MKTKFLVIIVAMCLFPSIANASYGICKTVTMKDTSMIPAKYKTGDYRFFKTDLCPPARADGEEFYIIWRGGECDSRVNIGVVRETPESTEYVWLDPWIGGTPGYFNLIGADKYLMWGLTLIDYHSNYYYSLVFEEGETFKLYSNQKTPIPLPPTLMFPEN